MDRQIDFSQLWNVFKRSFIAMIILGILGMAAAYFGASIVKSSATLYNQFLLVV